MKHERQTWYAIKCDGRVCGVMASYYSMELEAGELLFNASKHLAKSGHDCLVKFVCQNRVPCEDLTVEALLSEENHE